MPGRLNLKRPLVVFDLESTGTNARFDCIVEFAAIKIHPDSRRETFVFRVNPGRPIPPEATAVHGISDADVAGEPPFRDRAAEVKAFLSGCDFSGFGIARFDIPMLEHEMERAGQPLDLSDVRIVDCLRIFHRKEPRDLSAALRFYCNRELTDAHSAMADTEASLAVLFGQLERYPDLPGDVAGLQDMGCVQDDTAVDPDGKLRWRDGEVVIAFGQKSGMRLRDMAQHEPGYLRWMLNKDFSVEIKDIARRALAGDFPKREEAGTPSRFVQGTFGLDSDDGSASGKSGDED